MAGVRCSLPFGDSGSAQATGTGTKTAAQVLAASNHPIKITGFQVFGDGTNLTAAPIKAELLRQSTAGSGGTSVTPKKLDENVDATVQSTGLKNIVTTEPTAGDVLFPFQYHPSSGFTYLFPPGQEITATTRVGLRTLSPGADHNINGAIFFEE